MGSAPMKTFCIKNFATKRLKVLAIYFDSY
jgi:hypothetical protein